MNDPISNEEKAQLRDILQKFYGSSAASWSITIKTFEVFGRLIQETKACDRAMNLVPRPFGGGSVINWGRKQVRNAVLKLFQSSQAKHYIACMRAGAVRMKTEFYMSQFS